MQTLKNTFLTCLGTLLFISACTQHPPLKTWETYDEGPEIVANAEHPIKRMRYKGSFHFLPIEMPFLHRSQKL